MHCLDGPESNQSSGSDIRSPDIGGPSGVPALPRHNIRLQSHLADADSDLHGTAAARKRTRVGAPLDQPGIEAGDARDGEASLPAPSTARLPSGPSQSQPVPLAPWPTVLQAPQTLSFAGPGLGALPSEPSPAFPTAAWLLRARALVAEVAAEVAAGGGGEQAAAILGATLGPDGRLQLAGGHRPSSLRPPPPLPQQQPPKPPQQVPDPRPYQHQHRLYPPPRPQQPSPPPPPQQQQQPPPPKQQKQQKQKQKQKQKQQSPQQQPPQQQPQQHHHHHQHQHQHQPQQLLLQQHQHQQPHQHQQFQQPTQPGMGPSASLLELLPHLSRGNGHSLSPHAAPHPPGLPASAPPPARPGPLALRSAAQAMAAAVAALPGSRGFLPYRNPAAGAVAGLASGQGTAGGLPGTGGWA